MLYNKGFTSSVAKMFLLYKMHHPTVHLLSEKSTNARPEVQVHDISKQFSSSEPEEQKYYK